MIHVPQKQYDKWKEQEIQLFKQLLLQQCNTKKIDWDELTKHFPSRTKQQLISYRNGHRKELYGDMLKDSCESVVINQLSQSNESLKNCSSLFFKNSAQLQELTSFSVAYIENELSIQLLVIAIEGLELLDETQYIKKMLQNYPTFEVSNIIELRQQLRQQKVVKTVIQQGTDASLMYQNNYIMVKQLRSYYIYYVMKTLLFGNAIQAQNEIQQAFMEVVQRYLENNDFSLHEIQNILLHDHIIAGIYQQVKNSLLQISSLVPFVTKLTEGVVD